MRWEWIKAYDGTNPELPFGFGCDRCGQKEHIPSSFPIGAYMALAKSFMARHKGCNPQ
jgi:hypothetical protein